MQLSLPDYATRFDTLSLSACFLKLKGVGNEPRQATGFFWRLGSKVFLITNWHVVTGINMMDGKPIGEGWVPERIELSYFERQIANNPSIPSDPSMRTGLVPTVDVPLYEDFHNPFWIQHPMAFEWNVDLVALELGNLPDLSRVFCVNDMNYDKYLHFAGSDVFVLGHALPESTNAYPVPFPIWKRGSIASEIIVPWNMRPAFLIDSRTSKGMSGSPVFARIFGPAPLADLTIRADNILTSEFMGIYSGRLFDDDNNATIGLVWHRHLIDECLQSPARGSREWAPSQSIKLFAPLKRPEESGPIA
ncbi:serine protease [Bradyrhizobium sp. WSM4349]|uniref:serine protease n=1 Tax=Bradyrhizobium sp. WSM4349 TaxID=1040988 RepID=UPI000361D5E3|nr:serine protease [Bradyrhizobium sp. WSM4349]